MSLSMTERVERAIAKKPMTAKELRMKFPEVKNIYATIYDLIRRGYNISKIKELGKAKKYSL